MHKGARVLIGGGAARRQDCEKNYYCGKQGVILEVEGDHALVDVSNGQLDLEQLFKKERFELLGMQGSSVANKGVETGPGPISTFGFKSHATIRQMAMMKQRGSKGYATAIRGGKNAASAFFDQKLGSRPPMQRRTGSCVRDGTLSKSEMFLIRIRRS